MMPSATPTNSNVKVHETRLGQLWSIHDPSAMPIRVGTATDQPTRPNMPSQNRVQRVPTTEAQGRIHTSTVTVAVLPEAEEVEVDIDPNDLRIDVFRSSGPDGQSVNTTDSAVRITHLPTGLVVTCQDEKSQHKNKAKAMKVLRARLLDAMQQEQREKTAENRKSQVGSGDRSERIRTYNFPQNRVTDHRINLTLYKLEEILQGDIDSIIHSLTTHFKTESILH